MDKDAEEIMQRAVKEIEKQVVIDLSARLPYGVKMQVDYHDGDKPFVGTLRRIDFGSVYTHVEVINGSDYELCLINYTKPYLRSISNITKDEIFDLANIAFQGLPCDIDVSTGSFRICHYDEYGEVYEDYTVNDVLRYYCNVKALDWFYAHHFDVHDLIKRGLAVEAPKDMYEDLNYTNFTFRMGF